MKIYILRKKCWWINKCMSYYYYENYMIVMLFMYFFIELNLCYFVDN